MTRTEAKLAGLPRYEGKPCIHGHGAVRYVKNKLCVKCVHRKNHLTPSGICGRQAYDKRNAVRINELQRKRNAANPDRTKTVYLRTYAKNRSKWAIRAREREGVEKRATPLWVDQKAIAQIYVEAAWFTKETGVLHCVDHVVPLRGKNVCGLHVENNLRILTQAENDAKGNKHVA